MGELKACPFCGGIAELQTGFTDNEFFVGCTTHQCDMSTINTHKSIAISIWNKRQPHPAIKAVYDQMTNTASNNGLELTITIDKMWDAIKKAVEDQS